MNQFILTFLLKGSYLVFPCILLLIFLYGRVRHKWVVIILLLLSITFVYARYIEPQMIFSDKYKLNIGFPAKIALIGDLHVGYNKGEGHLETIVSIINKEKIDYVLIAGDITYHTDKAKLQQYLSPLKKLKVPCFAVLGNHDVLDVTEDFRDALVKNIEEMGVEILQNEIRELNGFTLVGLGSNFANEDDVSLLSEYSHDDNIVVLAHNPDTMRKYTNDIADITLSGHTHAGQIRIPYFYKKVIPTAGNYDRGYTIEKQGKLFVTRGVGESGVPLRFLNPPTIEILEFF